MTYGQGESTIAERIEDFENNLPEYKISLFTLFGRVRLRLSAKGKIKTVLEQSLKCNRLDEVYQLIP